MITNDNSWRRHHHADTFIIIAVFPHHHYYQSCPSLIISPVRASMAYFLFQLFLPFAWKHKELVIFIYSSEYRLRHTPVLQGTKLHKLGRHSSGIESNTHRPLIDHFTNCAAQTNGVFGNSAAESEIPAQTVVVIGITIIVVHVHNVIKEHHALHHRRRTSLSDDHLPPHSVDL